MGHEVARRFFEFFAVNLRNPHTRRAQDGSAEQSARSVENTGRRFRGWDISANVGVKLHAQVKDKMTRFTAEADRILRNKGALAMTRDRAISPSR